MPTESKEERKARKGWPMAVAISCFVVMGTITLLWPANRNHLGNGGNIRFIDGHVAWQSRLPAALKDKDGKEAVLSP